MPTQPRTYPQGVPSWIDTEQPDPDRAAEFYSAVFGWEFENVMPPEAPGVYLIATLDGADVGAVGSLGDGDTETPHWNTYIAVDDADAGAAEVTAAGGRLVVPPLDNGPGGRSAACADLAGAEFRLWQARRRLGAQVVNVPGAWNFSVLHAPDPIAALEFYRRVYGWFSIGADPALGEVMAAVPGYGEHLAATVDPGIRERQQAAPDGFADVVAGITKSTSGEAASWQVHFTVADRETTAADVVRLGGKVLAKRETQWTLEATVEDPQGARFGVSQLVGR